MCCNPVWAGSYSPSIIAASPWHTGVRELPAAENNPCRAAVRWQQLLMWKPDTEGNHTAKKVQLLFCNIKIKKKNVNENILNAVQETH